MKVVTFGEIMLRLEPEGYYRFVQVDKMTSTFGGAEANVAVSLANFGIESYYVTKLPSHEIGQAAVNALRRYGVHTEYVARGGERIGIYYNERGASQRGSKCIYDRLHSSIAEAVPCDFDWKKIFAECKRFHITGITPALGGKMTDICIEACKAAKDAGAVVSCDLNYRSKLWSAEQARDALTKICKYVDVCIANEEDAKNVFGIEAEGTDVAKGQMNKDAYKSVAKQLAERFGFEKVAFTLRTSINANENKWAALLYDGKEYYFSKEYEMFVVDRVGGGDSFSAGLIYSLLNGKSSAQTVEFAAAASCLKHSIEGDWNMVSVDEVEKLAGGNASGRIQR